MEGQDQTRGDEAQQEKQKQEAEDENVLQFLDSADTFLTLMDSLSSTLRQGWLELASARHSMGASRISSALFDLKLHSAATSLQVTQHDVGSMVKRPHFTLHKWSFPDDETCCSEEAKFNEDKLQKNANSPQLRHRGTSQFSELLEKSPTSDGSSLKIDNQIQKERSKSLSMFGTLVSPKLRAAQLSFETALETLIVIANMRSSMISAFDQIQKEMEDIKQ
ncbi:hypothetical protein L1049_026179 [Liquidambar formosana]|uniref:Vacuolar ATPase assembly protein VMA22 n=1 Tax=Liquidambar formosana TaxID=63359 RepID=A0AAP0R594_LIQFO